jgi:hypothetical protein
LTIEIDDPHSSKDYGVARGMEHRAKAEEGYLNEFLNLSFLVFIVFTILSLTLPKMWGIIAWCIGSVLLFVLLTLSYIYDPKRAVKNSLKEMKEEESEGS